jgi:hypothetical protein
MNSNFDSVGCDSRIRHRTKIGLFLSLDAAVTSDTVKITVCVNRPLPRYGRTGVEISLFGAMKSMNFVGAYKIHLCMWFLVEI